jgi:hypothetical protein
MTWLHAVLDVPAGQRREAADFWSQALGWPAGEPWDGHPELRSFEPPEGAAYVHLQEVDGAPRVHVDLESNDAAATVERAVDLGAGVVARRDSWTTMSSPGGLPFCVLHERQHAVPGPISFADGHSARLVQVCVDSPVSAHDAEVAFWRALLSGRWVPSDSAEFEGKWHDDHSPLQLLFQRLDEPDGPARAHLDLGTDDLDAEVRRITGLGAGDVAPGRGWHVLRDPLGQLFCATENSPERVWPRDLG